MKRTWNKYIYLLASGLFVITACVQAADSATRAITPSQWKQLATDKAFTYKSEIEQLKPTPKESSHFLEQLLLLLLRFFSSGIGRLILWAAILALLILILNYVLKTNQNFLFGRKSKRLKSAGLPETDDNFATANWEQKLQQALLEKDLRLAVRYSYMWLLHMLNERQLIRYTADKTNFEYACELESTLFKQPFRQLSRKYEYTWYGNYPLSAAEYNEFIDLFTHVRKQLGQ